MFHRLGKFVSRYWLWVVLIWLIGAAGIRYAAPAWDDVTHDGDLAYLPDRTTSIRGEARLRAAFPELKTKSQMAVLVERRDGRLRYADFEIAKSIAERFRNWPDADSPIVEVWAFDHPLVGDKLVSSPSRAATRGQATLVLAHLSNEFMATDNVFVLRDVQALLDEIRQRDDFPEGLDLWVSGSAAIGGDMALSAHESIQRTELTTIFLVVAILLVIYRAPLLVIVPLSTIALAIVTAMSLVAWLTEVPWLDFKVFTTTKIFVVVILFGAGTDYCLFLISRYREELRRDPNPATAIAAALGNVGDALAASALTTIVGLGMMYFADFGKFTYSGPMIALCLSVAVVACVTFTPALLRAGGTLVFWPFGIDASRNEQDDPPPSSIGNRVWGPIGSMIVARPGLILVVCVLALLPAAYSGFDVAITYNLLGELRDDRPSVQGTAAVQRHFYAGDVGPLTVVAERASGGLDTRTGAYDIARLTRMLYDVDGVKRVRSLTSPLGEPPVLNFRHLRRAAARSHPVARKMYLAQDPTQTGKVTRLDLVLVHDPFSVEATALLDRIDTMLADLAKDRESPWYGAEFDFVGTTAGKRDLQAVTESDQSVIQRLVLLAVMFVLVAILRRPLICTYLMLSVLFTYFVTIGATESIFAWTYGADFDGLDWKVPIFLFVILVAIGQDYNIYLVTRVFEEQARCGPLEGIRRAVARTGGIITSCGIIMAGTFLSMMTGTLRGMLELGFALSLGVLLDTFVVRPVLVPAFLTLVARRSSRREPPSPDQRSSDDGATDDARRDGEADVVAAANVAAESGQRTARI